MSAGLFALLGVVATGASSAGADIVLPGPLGPITVPLPGDPTPTTSPPPTDPATTTTQPDPTTTATAPASTGTTAPRGTTTTRSPRRSTTTTAGARAARDGSSTGPASGPPRPDGSSAAKGSAASAGERVAPVTATRGTGTQGTGASDRLRSSFLRATGPASGSTRTFDGSALAGIVLAGATALVLGLAQRDAAQQRRSQATLVGSGALRVGRDESGAGVREQLRAMLAGGSFVATGTDCRSLQLLVQAAAHEGLEVRDPRGFIVAATRRLVQAYGVAPDRKRLPLRWAVEVGRPTMEVPDGYGFVLARTGPTDDGRLLAFTPGTEMVLWSGDCL